MFVRIDLIQSGLVPINKIVTKNVALGKNLVVTRASNKGGVRVRSAAGERLTCLSMSDATTIDKVIHEREDIEHREYLPDPVDRTVDDLLAKVERLEKRIAELESQLENKE